MKTSTRARLLAGATLVPALAGASHYIGSARADDQPGVSGLKPAHTHAADRLEDGDLQEALDAVLAVGDFNASDPGHHGTPEQREEAWRNGFDSGDPASCDRYLEPA